MLTLDDLVAIGTRRRREVSREEIEQRLATIDQTAVHSEVAASVRWERWDRESSINGAAAEVVLRRPDVGDGEVYLVLVNDRVLYVQPHHPGESGLTAISEDELAEVAEDHVNRLVETMARQEIVRRVLSRE